MASPHRYRAAAHWDVTSTRDRHVLVGRRVYEAGWISVS